VLAAASGADESSLYFWNATTGKRAADLGNINATTLSVKLV
jgi:hypothetical protein